jgi:hypothetical protein
MVFDSRRFLVNECPRNGHQCGFSGLKIAARYHFYRRSSFPKGFARRGGSGAMRDAK